MPSQVVFDIFPLVGVTPNYANLIAAGNRILAANHPTINVTMKIGKIQELGRDTKGAEGGKITGGDHPAGGGTGAQDWRYSEQQRSLLGALPPQPAPTPGSGSMPVVWAESFTQDNPRGIRLGEAVNPGVFDSTYRGRGGIFMVNSAATFDAVLLHETLHMVGLQHVAPLENVMHATMTGASVQNKLDESQKRALADASF